MKNQLLRLLGLFFLFNSAYSQPDDRQWLIWKNFGWDGPSNNYRMGTSISNQFSLQGISHPDTTGTRGSRNDIFIIYSDGEHFNSRYERHPGFFYPPSDTDLRETNHNFNNLNRNGNVSYMYMTNRYEIDEPPMSMTVPDGHVASSTPPYDVGLTPALLAANHDVAFTKDITIIVNYDSIINSHLPPIRIKADYANTSPNGVVLRYDGIKNVLSGTTTFNIDFLDLKNVFDDGGGAMEPGHPNQGYDSVATNYGQIELKPGQQKYRYINLVTNRRAYQYGPDSVTGEATDSALFTVFNRGVPVAMIAEPILHSHDPNFLKIEKICKMDNGGHLVYYLLEFENTSPTVTPPDGPGVRQGLSVNIDFPSIFDLTCLKLTGWFSGGDEGSCRIEINNTGSRQRQFVFRHEGQLKKCNNPGDDHCIGRIRFSVKVNPGIDVTDLNTDLMLDNIQVYFGHVSFPIHEFFDIKECKFIKDTDDNSNEADVNANETEVNPNEPGKDPKKEPGYAIDPDSTDFNIDNNELVIDNNSDAPDGHIRCYRPVTQGKCSCDSGPGPVVIILGLAAVAFLITMLVKIIRRRRISPPTPQGNPAPPPPQG